jgi:hypothetical protein
MSYPVMLLKAAAWLFAFWSGIGRGLLGMLVQAAAITVFLTVVDGTTAGDRALPAQLLTLLLYALMSFTLLSVAWKLRNPAVSLACNVAGTLGAFAIVNFTIEFIVHAAAKAS